MNLKFHQSVWKLIILEIDHIIIHMQILIGYQ